MTDDSIRHSNWKQELNDELRRRSRINKTLELVADSYALAVATLASDSLTDVMQDVRELADRWHHSDATAMAFAEELYKIIGV